MIGFKPILPGKVKMIKSKIPVGTLCCQDFRVFVWPRNDIEKDIWFMATKHKNGSFTFIAPGYGQREDYGCGAIYVPKDVFGKYSKGGRS